MNALVGLLHAIRPEVDFSIAKDFITDGLLDSFDMMALVSALDKAFAISIDGVDIVPEHFRSLETIAELLRKYDVQL